LVAALATVTIAVGAAPAASVGRSRRAPARGSFPAIAGKPGGSGGSTTNYFATVPSSEKGSPPAGIPRMDATCAAAVVPKPENRPQSTTANHTVPPSPSAVDWGTALNYWTKFVADRNHVTGDFTGTTDEILQWTACKWGIDVNLVRADAVVESYWVQSTLGDNCGVAGEASYGLLQVMNKDCSGNSVHGGYPYTQKDSALDVDYWGARMRACFDGAFYNGGQWLYNGQTIAQVISQHSQGYALWGCVGSWFSGGWYDSGAQGYIAKVRVDYRSKPWLKPGF
jgi:autotransporter family porin